MKKFILCLLFSQFLITATEGIFTPNEEWVLAQTKAILSGRLDYNNALLEAISDKTVSEVE